MQKTYSKKFDISRAGFLSGRGTPRVRAYKNSADTKADYVVFAIPAAPVANTEYFMLDSIGRRASYITDANPTQAELGAGLLSAIRNSPLYDVATPKLEANVLTVTSRSEIDSFSLTYTNVGGFSGTTFNFGASSPSIPFGVLVARRATDLEDEVRLPSASTDKIVGVSMSTYATEKTAIGQAAKVAYQPNEAMDILDRCNDLDGIWVTCVEPDLSLSDPLYVCTVSPKIGWLTRSASGNIPLTSASLVKGGVTNSDGTVMALLSINLS